VLAFLAADSPSTNENQLQVQSTRYDTVHYGPEHVNHFVFVFVFHSIAYLEELVRDIVHQLPAHDLMDKSDNDNLSKVRLEVRQEFEFGKNASPMELS